MTRTYKLKGKSVFQVCNYCGCRWSSRGEFLADETLLFNGYQADFESPDKGLFLFTHRGPGCGTTLALEIRHFIDLYHGPVYSERKLNSSDCPGHCANIFNLERCENKCEFAYIRELIQIVRKANGIKSRRR